MTLWPCSAKAALALWPRPTALRQPLHSAFRSFSTETVTISPIPSKKFIGRIREDWDKALQRGSADDVVAALSRFRMTVLKAEEESQRRRIRETFRMNGSLLDKTIQVLSNAPKKGCTLEMIFRESESTFGTQQSSSLLLSILNALVNSGETMKAFHILRSFNKSRGNVAFYPNSRHWLCVMEGFANKTDIDSLLMCLRCMHRHFPLPDNSHYQCLLKGMVNSETTSPQEVLDVLDEMHRCGLPYDKDIHDTLATLTKKDSFVFTHIDYETRFEGPKRRPSMAVVDNWIKELLSARQVAKSAFEQKLRRLRYRGFVPGPSVLQKLTMLDKVSSVAELRYLSFCLGTPIDLEAWTNCLHNVLRSQGWRAALEVYGHAKKDGVQPDAKMLDVIIRAMLQVPLKQLSDEVIDRIVMLLDDLGDRADLPIYNLTLHALISSSNETKYFPIAMDILRRMKKRDIKLDVMAATSAAQVLIRSASSFEEAKAAYEEIRNVSDPPLDLIGYRAVLSAFTRLELRVSPMEASSAEQVEYEGMRLSIPPASTYFEIIKDMRDRGYPVSSYEYSILLSRYAMLATRARSLKDPLKKVAVFDAIRADIEETHRRISLDAGLELEGVLMNRLMDAYNRVGSLGDAMRMWTMLVTTGKVSAASISIVFDTVGHGRSIARADAVFAEIKKMGFELNVWNWNAWLECLCRLYRFAEAAQVVQKEMPAHGIAPNEETWRVLASFGLKVESFKNFPPTLMATIDEHRRTRPVE